MGGLWLHCSRGDEQGNLLEMGEEVGESTLTQWLSWTQETMGCLLQASLASCLNFAPSVMTSGS